MQTYSSYIHHSHWRYSKWRFYWGGFGATASIELQGSGEETLGRTGSSQDIVCNTFHLLLLDDRSMVDCTLEFCWPPCLWRLLETEIWILLVSSLPCLRERNPRSVLLDSNKTLYSLSLICGLYFSTSQELIYKYISLPLELCIRVNMHNLP